MTIPFSPKRQIRESSGSEPCPICNQPDCMERPRFFSGQLLTEAELTSQQAYVLAKNRLHNRYLHGSGVVCGLEVVCHRCEGVLVVQPGYAIGPCGNDILVNEPSEVDLLALIKEQRQAARRGGCDPAGPVRPRACDGEEEQWCLAVVYDEKQVRPVTPLAHAGRHSGCEATRICESYRFEVRPAPEQCRSVGTENQELSNSVPTEDGGSNFIWEACGQELRSFFNQQGIALDQILTTVVQLCTGLQTEFATHRAHAFDIVSCQKLQKAVKCLYRKNPLKVRYHCNVLATLGPCPELPSDTGIDDPAYKEYVAHMKQLVRLFTQYLIDCLYQQLLPPCPPTPTDPGIILACVTVRDNTILHVNNGCCRTFAGSFPAVNHWLSLLPQWRTGQQFYDRLVCGDDRIQCLIGLLSFQGDPTKETMATTSDAYTTALKTVFGPAGDFIARATRLAPEKQVNLSGLTAQPLSDVKNRLDEKGVQLVTREVTSADNIPQKHKVPTILAGEGERLIAYHNPEGKVVGFGRYDVADELEEKTVEVNKLRGEMDTLRSQLYEMQTALDQLRNNE